MPRLRSENYEGMELIRPLYLVREKAVLAWQAAMGLEPIACACRVTRQEDGGKRARVKRLLKELESEQPNVVDNIVASSEAVNLGTLLSTVTREGEAPSSFMKHFTNTPDGGIINHNRLF